MSDYSIKRGPWGKPYITRDGKPLDWPEGERDPVNGFLYDRPSDISGNLDTKENLSPYHQAQAVFGVVTEPPPHALIKQFRSLASMHVDPWTDAKGEVKELLKLARKYGGEEFKSGAGSALHNYTVLVDQDRDIEYGASDFEPWLDCYRRAMEGRFTVIDWERFVVCDDLDDEFGPNDLRTAGNYDKLAIDNHTGQVIVMDVKTGRQDNEYLMKPTIQVAIYARSKHYAQATGVREAIHDALDVKTGALIHLPYNGRGEPECIIYPLDLERGWQLAQTSSELTKARKMRGFKRGALGRAKWAPEPDTSPETPSTSDSTPSETSESST